MQCTKQQVIEAYQFLRDKNFSIPSEALSFIKDAALTAISQTDTENLVTAFVELRIPEKPIDERLSPEAQIYIIRSMRSAGEQQCKLFGHQFELVSKYGDENRMENVSTQTYLSKEKSVLEDLDLEFILEVLENERPAPREDHEAYYTAIKLVKEAVAKSKA